MRVAGVDGTKGGWIVVVLRDARFESARRIDSIETDFSDLGELRTIAIDVPIGFGPGRAADAAARAFLRGAASTVFPTPTRAQVSVPFRPGSGVSAQSHALGPRIVFATDLATRDPRIREVHPEVSFRAMNDGKPLAYRKKCAGGALERVALLARHGIVIEDAGTASTAPIDDVLDAAAAAWSAHRIATSVAFSLPDPPELRDGRPVAIWF